jgi:hypothetical protein
MKGLFKLGAASIPGADHLQRGNVLIGRNCGDAYAWHQDENLTIGVVADGCGSQEHSEVGAYLGATLLVRALQRQTMRYMTVINKDSLKKTIPLILEAARQDVLAHLRILAQALTATSFSTAVNESFLFTLVGTLITPYGAAFFGIGDGVRVVNGEWESNSYPANEPPYIAYALYASRWKDDELHFVVHRVVRTEDLNSFMIGTDGCTELAGLAERTIPGSSELIGPVESLWTRPDFYTKTGLRRWLARINSRVSFVRNGELAVDIPRLHDDTTLIVGSRT